MNPSRHWIFDRGYYTHDRKSGKRVDQYEKVTPVYRVPNDEYYAPTGPHPYGPYDDFVDYPSAGFRTWGTLPHYVPYFHLDPFLLPPALLP